MRNGLRHSVWLMLIVGLPVRAEVPAQVLDMATQRDYGVVMGQVLASDIRVKVATGFRLQSASLPQPGAALEDYLELRQLDWQAEPQAGFSVYHIALRYQVFKGARNAEEWSVPALPLRFERGGEAAEVEAPAWRFTLTPIIAPQTPDDAVKLRGPAPMPQYDGAAPAQGFAGALAGLLGLGLYAAWRLGYGPGAQVAPFAQAARQLRRLGGGKTLDAEAYSRGMRLLHAALNAAAGHALCAARLEEFLHTQPHYAAAREELARFFAVSEQWFFGCKPSPAPIADEWSRLLALGGELARLERKGKA